MYFYIPREIFCVYEPVKSFVFFSANKYFYLANIILFLQSKNLTIYSHYKFIDKNFRASVNRLIPINPYTILCLAKTFLFILLLLLSFTIYCWHNAVLIKILQIVLGKKVIAIKIKTVNVCDFALKNPT